MADDSGGVVNLIKHKVLVLILLTRSADVIAIARSQPGDRSIRSILCEGAGIHLQAPLAKCAKHLRLSPEPRLRGVAQPEYSRQTQEARRQVEGGAVNTVRGP